VPSGINWEDKSMKSAAMPAAETLDLKHPAVTPHLKLVPTRDEAPAPAARPATAVETDAAEDLDEMWDNLPV
jgi:hypothetical protein